MSKTCEEKKNMQSDTSKEEENQSKRIKSSLTNILSDFQLVKVLNESSQSKLIFVQAIKRETPANKTQNGDAKEQQSKEARDAVVIFEKPHFSVEEVVSFFKLENEIDLDITNDIYKKISLYPSKPYNNVQVQLIYPASEKHIAKYSMQEMYFVTETADDWSNITSKYIESALDIQWVFNILEHKTESERIIYEDADAVNGFILLPDMKWDSRVVENLYLLAIVHQKNIRSLRDLNATHLPLLENIRAKSLASIEEKFGVKKDKIRAYIHYQPTFYHLHVHFSHIKYQAPGMPERNHPLNSVIENLKIDSEYYKKASIQIVLKQNEKLYDLFKHKLE